MRQLKITQNITNRENQSLEKYFQDVNKIEMITSEEEVVLAQRIQDGDAAALEKLVKSNLRFVVSVAKQYQNQGLSLPDLIHILDQPVHIISFIHSVCYLRKTADTGVSDNSCQDDHQCKSYHYHITYFWF